MSILTLRRPPKPPANDEQLTRIALNQEELLRRLTRIETRLVKLLLANGLTEDGRAAHVQD